MEQKYTPGPWVVAHDHPDEDTRKSLASIRPLKNGGHTELEIADIYCCGGDAEREANARLIAAAPELHAVASNFEVTGPDADGLVWLVMHGNGTTGKAMFNLGSHSNLAAQVALHLESDRRAAIAKATGAN